MIVWLQIGTLCIFAADILLKQAVEEKISPGEEREILGGVVIIRKVYNKGAVLRLLEKYPKVVKTASSVCGMLMLFYDGVLWSRKGRWLHKAGMVLFTGGAWSNIFDRIVRGKVVDYLGFRTKWKKITKITYNLGDLAIFLGAFLVGLGELLD